MSRRARFIRRGLFGTMGVALVACGVAPAVPEAPVSPTALPPVASASASSSSLVDAAATALVPDATADTVPAAGQGDTGTAPDFPGFPSCAGLVEGQCCSPAPSVSLCMRATPANHATGNYTARILVVNTTNKGATMGTMLPLVTRTHGSMKIPDPIVERLEVKVTASDVTLVAAQGCRSAAKPRTTVCAAEGHYGLRGDAFLRLDPEE